MAAFVNKVWQRLHKIQRQAQLILGKPSLLRETSEEKYIPLYKKRKLASNSADKNLNEVTPKTKKT
jgi:hypothetical protein